MTPVPVLTLSWELPGLGSARSSASPHHGSLRLPNTAGLSWRRWVHACDRDRRPGWLITGHGSTQLKAWLPCCPVYTE